MTQIIGFAGKKMSGKNTCCNFVMMLKLLELGVCKNAQIADEGHIEVTDIYGESFGDDEWMPFKSPTVDVDAVLDNLGQVKIYAFADTLKEIAINVLGIPREQIYGTDKDKNENTHLLWQNMPGITTVKTPNSDVDAAQAKVLQEYYEEVLSGVTYHEPGLMTAREVLQFMGTEIFRKMYDNVWIYSLLRRIEEDNVKIALICDVRFDNEITTLQDKGAIVIGLEKDVFDGNDTHSSERVDLSLCKTVIRNSNITIAEQNKLVYFALKDAECDHLTNLGV